MRRFIAALLLAALLLAPACALAQSLNENMFSSAKEALSLISYGEYKKALKKLGLSSSKEDVQLLSDFVSENLTSAQYATVQQEVSVGYKLGNHWKICVPVEEPSYRGVEVLVVLSKDGETFTGYKSMLWGDVKDELAEAESVTWNKAYDPGEPVIVVDE